MLSFQSASIAIAVIGGVIACVAHRRSARGAPLDVRSEIRAERDALRMAVGVLFARFNMERRSRTAAAEAKGDLATAEFRQWLAELEADESELKRLESESQLLADADFDGLSAVQLDITLLEILASSWRANSLAEKYQAATALAAKEGERRLDALAEGTTTIREVDLVGPRAHVA